MRLPNSVFCRQSCEVGSADSWFNSRLMFSSLCSLCTLSQLTVGGSSCAGGPNQLSEAGSDLLLYVWLSSKFCSGTFLRTGTWQRMAWAACVLSRPRLCRTRLRKAAPRHGYQRRGVCCEVEGVRTCWCFLGRWFAPEHSHRLSQMVVSVQDKDGYF